jgi:hypothetical protein
MREHIARRGWSSAITIQDVQSCAKQRPQREAIMDAARRLSLT